MFTSAHLPGGRLGKLPASAVLACILLLAGGCQPPPAPAIPEDLAELDPAVRALVEGQIAVVEDNPRDADAHGELGLMYTANSVWASAQASFANALSLDPDNFLWRFYLAMATQEVGQTDAAIGHLQALAGADPQFAPVQHRLGELLLKRGDIRGANAAFERVVALMPDSPAGYVGLGEVRIQSGQSEQAIPVLEKAIEIETRYGVAHYLLGVAYRNSNRLEEASRELSLGAGAKKRMLSEDTYREQLETYRVNSSAQNEKGVNLMMSGKAAAAEDVFRQMLNSDPEHITALNNLSIALMRQGKLDEAGQVLDRALAVNDVKFTTYANLTSLAMRRKDSDEALRYARETVERAPERYEAHFTLGRLLLSKSAFEEALSSLARAVDINDRHAPSRVFLAEAYLRTNQTDAAREQFLAALDLEPKSLRAHAGMVRAGLQDGDLESAEKHWAVLHQVAPDNPDVRKYRQQLNDARG